MYILVIPQNCEKKATIKFHPKRKLDIWVYFSCKAMHLCLKSPCVCACMSLCTLEFICPLAGITSLLANGVYTAAYPLHDVSTIITFNGHCSSTGLRIETGLSSCTEFLIFKKCKLYVYCNVSFLLNDPICDY